MKSSIYSPSSYSPSSSPDLELFTPASLQDNAALHEEHDERVHEICILGVAPPRTAVKRVQRAVDVMLALLLLLVLWPLFVVLAAAIRLDTHGPVLFTQMRVGQGGREFPFFKFRSMVHEAEAQRRALEQMNERTGPVFKMRDDPRVTRVGRFLRRASLDELPQLLNVLRGEMSLVGPRPALPREVAQYTPRQRGRLAVTPGVTGLWQVSGRADVDFEKSVELDLTYVQNQSLWLYVKILCLTLPAVVSGRGAY